MEDLIFEIYEDITVKTRQQQTYEFRPPDSFHSSLEYS